LPAGIRPLDLPGGLSVLAGVERPDQVVGVIPGSANPDDDSQADDERCIERADRQYLVVTEPAE
jgi:hypothetical protein